MKKNLLVKLSCIAGMCVATSVLGQTSGQQSIGQALNVYVFPSKGQTSEQQNKDEGTCYQWAVTNSGVDPFKVQKEQEAQTQQAAADKQDISEAGAGAGARGAVGGAATGALIGGIADGDAGKGAAWGAAAGILVGRRRARMEKEEASQAVDTQQQQSQQLSASQMTNFKNAFSVCLEAKNYMVKY